MRVTELQVGNKLFGRNVSLFQDAAQGAGIDFTVHRHDATTFLASQDGVTAALTEKHEP